MSEMEMPDLELMRVDAGILYTHDGAGRMLRVNEPGGAEAPRFFLGRTPQGRVWRVRHDVDDALARALEAACAAEPLDDEFLLPPHGAEPYERLLARAAAVQEVGGGPVYRFAERLSAAPDAVRVTAETAGVLRPHLESWLGDALTAQPMVAVLAEGRAVSVCCSVRIGAAAHEAGVETAPGFRGRGYAAQAVVAWAAAVRAMGCIPLYSTSWQNTASQALAQKLGLRRFATTLQIT
jgi:GNAT superfamily N-acetyltransferase